VYSFGKSAAGDLAEVLALTLDPYCVAPLWPDADSIAALQARAFLEKTGKTERDLAEVAVRSRRDAKSNPHAVLKGDVTADELLATPYVSSPLRAHDCPINCDGATAMVIVAGERAKKVVARPVWIRGIDHRVDPPALGVRDDALAVDRDRRGQSRRRPRPIAAPDHRLHQELILRRPSA
jgi:acetyl-CoA acetyltransferase